MAVVETAAKDIAGKGHTPPFPWNSCQVIQIGKNNRADPVYMKLMHL